MDKNILRQVLADNAKLIGRLDVMPREYNVETDKNYIFTGVRSICVQNGWKIVYAICVDKKIAFGRIWYERYSIYEF